MWLHFCDVFLFTMVTSKKFSFSDWSSYSLVYCIALLSLFKIFRNLWSRCTVSNLAWLSSTYYLYVNGANLLSEPAVCIALSSKYCMKTSKITAINSKPIGVQFRNIRTQLPSVKKLVLKHNSISWCISESVRFLRFTKSSMPLYQHLTTQRLPWIQKIFTFLISNKFATFKNIKKAKIILIIKIFQCVTSLYILFYISDITNRKILTIK